MLSSRVCAMYPVNYGSHGRTTKWCQCTAIKLGLCIDADISYRIVFCRRYRSVPFPARYSRVVCRYLSMKMRTDIGGIFHYDEKT